MEYLPKLLGVVLTNVLSLFIDSEPPEETPLEDDGHITRKQYIKAGMKIVLREIFDKFKAGELDLEESTQESEDEETLEEGVEEMELATTSENNPAAKWNPNKGRRGYRSQHERNQKEELTRGRSRTRNTDKDRRRWQSRD